MSATRSPRPAPSRAAFNPAGPQPVGSSGTRNTFSTDSPIVEEYHLQALTRVYHKSFEMVFGNPKDPHILWCHCVLFPQHQNADEVIAPMMGPQ